MADTYRPERKPISPQEAANGMESKFKEMSEMRRQASSEGVGADEVGGEPIPAVKFSGNVPAALLQRTAIHEREVEERDERGPKQRQKPSDRDRGASGEDVLKSTSSEKVQELLNRLKVKTATYDKITLPSLGKFYDGSDGPTDGVIHIRPMTGEEEQILATPRFVKSGQAINKIFSRCIQESFETANFIAADRTYLLIYLRGISYSHEYDVEVTCPNCERKFATTIDLNNMMVDPCPEDFGPDDLEDVLPTSGFRFRYRLATGADEQKVQDYRDRKLKGFDTAGQADDTLLFRAALMVDNIEGVDNKFEIQKLLKSLPINDVAYLRSRMNEPPFGVDTKIEMPCGSCSQDFEIDLPLEANFFFPRAKKKIRS